MASDPILGAILSAFIESAQRDSFNGLVAASLLRFEDNPDRLRAHLASLVDEHKITCVFASAEVNMHIKRVADLPIDRQRALLKTEALKEFCVYPTGSEIVKNIDITRWNNRPFSKALALAEPQLAYRAFDMGALERYTSDPRYTVHFAGNYPFDIGNTMCSDLAASTGSAVEAGAPEITCPYCRRCWTAPEPYPEDNNCIATHYSGNTGTALREAVDNPFSLISAFRATDSPLHEVHLHPGILAVASMLTDTYDCPGIEPYELEVLLRSTVYLDRLQRIA